MHDFPQHNLIKLYQTCCLELPNEIKSSRYFCLLTVNDLTDKEEHNKNQINEESFSVEEPHLTCLVAQHE